MTASRLREAAEVLRGRAGLHEDEEAPDLSRFESAVADLLDAEAESFCCVDCNRHALAVADPVLGQTTGAGA